VYHRLSLFDQYDLFRECLEGGAVVTKELHEGFQQLSFTTFLDRNRNRDANAQRLWYGASKLLKVLRNRELHDMYANHLSGIRDAVLSFLPRYPRNANIILSAYVLCYKESQSVYLPSMFPSYDMYEDLRLTVEEELLKFDEHSGFGLAGAMETLDNHFSLGRDGSYRRFTALGLDIALELEDDFPLGCLLTNDPILRGYAFCSQSHAALALHLLHCMISYWDHHSRNYYPYDTAFHFFPLSLVYASTKSEDLVTLVTRVEEHRHEVTDFDHEYPECQERAVEIIVAMRVYLARCKNENPDIESIESFQSLEVSRDIFRTIR